MKQSHARIMGILPSDERVHHSTLRAQQIKSGGRVKPSTNHIDRGITGPTQHGNHLEEIFVDEFRNRLDGECGEQATSKIHFRIPSSRGVRGGHFHPTNTQGVSGFLQSALASNEAVWGASPIPAAQPVALFARPDQEFSC